MEYSEFKRMIESTGMPSRYDHFGPAEIPDPPYITWYENGTNNFKADNVVYQKISRRTALCPFALSARHTPVPEMIEISRSVLVPPAKTTIFILADCYFCANLALFLFIVTIHQCFFCGLPARISL